MTPSVVGVHRDDLHRFSKPSVGAIVLRAGLGVEGDAQLDAYQDGVQRAVLDRAPDGSLVRRAGVTAVVLVGGVVRPGRAGRYGPERKVDVVDTGFGRRVGWWT